MNLRIMLSAAIAGAVVVGFAAASTAQRRGLDPDATWRVLKRHDKNGDGKVSASEYRRGEAKFRAFDRDGDGFITRNDLDIRAGRGGRPTRRGRSPVDAYAAAAAHIVRAADANTDGTTDAKEWKTWVERTLPNGRLGRGAFGRAVGKRLAARRIDANRDDIIDRAELSKAFKHLDKNKDGSISESERPAGARGRGGRGGAVPQPGEVAPDFDLPFTKASLKRTAGRKTMRLSSFKGKRSVGLIFGSYT